MKTIDEIDKKIEELELATRLYKIAASNGQIDNISSIHAHMSTIDLLKWVKE